MFPEDVLWWLFLSVFILFGSIFFFSPRLFPEDVCSHNAEALLNAIRQKSSLFDGTSVPALWIKNDSSITAWASQKENEENNPQTHDVFVFYDSKNLYLKKDKMGIIGWMCLKVEISEVLRPAQLRAAVQSGFLSQASTLCISFKEIAKTLAWLSLYHWSWDFKISVGGRNLLGMKEAGQVLG